MVAFVSIQLLIALVGTATARKSGGGGGGNSFFGGSSSSSSSHYGSSTNTGHGGSTNTVYQPVRSYGSGYADKSKFSGGGNSYGRYPNGGLRPSMIPFFFMGGGNNRRHHNRNNDDNDNDYDYDDDMDLYFERVENGCQFTSINSYRTIDNENASVFDSTTNTTKSNDWVGCTEEWKYNASVVGDPTRTFVSPSIELYACDEYDSCSECDDELSGENFNALALEAYEYPPDGTFAVDCWIPKNLTLAREEFECNNDECIYFSEKYQAVSVETNSGTSFSSGISISSVVFPLVILACFVAGVFWFRRRRNNKKSTATNQPTSNTEATPPVQADKEQPYGASSSVSTMEQIEQVKPSYSAPYAQEQEQKQKLQSYVAASS